MKVHHLLSEELIEPNLTAASKRAVLEGLVKLVTPGLAAAGPVTPEQVLAALQDREDATSTGIGNGVAIPHAKVEGLRKIVVAFARSQAGIDFEALDDNPVHLIFLVIAPPDSVSDYIKLLGAISAFLKSEKNRAALKKAANKAEIAAAVKSGER